MGRLLAVSAVVGLVLACAAAPFVGCVDLFHSTDFGTCLGDGGPGCSQPEGAPARDAPAPDGRARKDAGHKDAGQKDAGHRTDAGDATVPPHDAAHDATPDSGHDAAHDQHVVDAGRDAAHDAHDAGVDAPRPVDAGTDFCAWSADTAASHAVYACLWLGACAGNPGLNEFGTCYPNALMAYNCALNPNQRVTGPLHTYWDALWQASSCDAVLAAVFAGRAPTCGERADASAAGGVMGCVATSDGGGASVATVCIDGGLAAAVHCDMEGYRCIEGSCTNGGSPCSQPTAASCTGNVFHSCQNVPNEAGTIEVVVDVGKDCSHFGAGKCVLAENESGGCLPNDAGQKCTASAIADPCSGADTVTGCATGYEESLYCAGFGPATACSGVGNRVVSSSQLAAGCYNPMNNGFGDMMTGCAGLTAFYDYAGPAGAVEIYCADAGLGSCDQNAVGGFRPYCGLEGGVDSAAP